MFEQRDFIDFCSGSATFKGISFYGSVNIPLEDFDFAFKHYLLTGKNYLDEYVEWTHLRWKAESFLDCKCNFLSRKDIKIAKYLIDGKGFWNPRYMVSEESMDLIKQYIYESEYIIKKKAKKCKK